MKTTFLLLVPLFTLLMLWGLTFRRGWANSRAGALLRALVLWALAACWMVEILSLLKAITLVGLLLGWLIAAAVVALLWLRTPHTPAKAQIFSFGIPSLASDRISLAFVAAALVLTAVVASLTPPQTWDSLNYHMPRVAHWAQQHSVEHYATGIEVQNSRAPGSEYLLLQVYVLSNGDQVIPLVNWLFYAAAILCAFVVAGRFDRRARWLSAAVLAAIPMAIIQASGTVNDIVVGLWVMVFAWEILHLDQGNLRPIDYVFLGGPASLALMTKPTAFAYILPLSVWAFFRLVRSNRARSLGPGFLLLVLVFVSLNAPYLLRNQQTYGSPFSEDQVEIHSNQIHTPAVLISNTLRNMALHASTPIPEVNKAVFLAVVKAHDLMGLSQNDPRTTAHAPFRVHSFSTHEERSGNVVHAILILVASLYLFRNREQLPDGLVYFALASVTAFLLLGFLFQWQVFASRYHLAFFMLWAPILGVIIAKIKGWQRIIILGVLFISSVPWLISIRSRPLFPIPGQVSAPSVLTGARKALYFTNGEYLERPYTQIAKGVTDQNCKVVGLAISGSNAEYLLWEELGAPDPDLQIEWLVADTPSARYQGSNFEPCAVICQNCAPEQQEYRGLSLADRVGSYSLYLEGAR